MIERLLVLKLDAVECEAEACLNGMPIARAHAGQPRVVLPVHEYTLSGANRLELVVWPHPAALPPGEVPASQPLVATGRASAHARLLLPRIDNVADESSARTLAQLDWTPDAGTRFAAPITLQQDVQLPVSFPRWRWLEAPPVADLQALLPLARDYVQSLATSLAAGDAEPYLAAVRLRIEECAAAYQEDPREATDRLRRHLRGAFDAGRLQNWQPLDSLALRLVAGNRLVECLSPEGTPALCTETDDDGRTLALPLRMAFVENRFYVLR
jgi:hypothetical protein